MSSLQGRSIIVTEAAWESLVVVVGEILLLPGNVQMGGTIGTLGHTGFVRPPITGLTSHYTLPISSTGQSLSPRPQTLTFCTCCSKYARPKKVRPMESHKKSKPQKWSLISRAKIPFALGVDSVQAPHQVLEEELEGLGQT